MVVETLVIKCRIVRRTSKYNKYIKWFTECYSADGLLLSTFGYRTRREAEAELKDDNVGLTIGNKTVKTRYQFVD